MKRTPAKQTVFINCPFDEEFRPFFKAMVFCITFLDHHPTFAESISSSDFRLKKITELIRKARLGIHDLSRNTSTKEGEKARFNMPFELGLDMGSILFGGKSLSQKKIIVFDTNPNDYDHYIGDISGQDILVHQNQPEILIKEIRNWFSRLYPNLLFPSFTHIWNAYRQFNEKLPLELKDSWSTHELHSMQMSEYRHYAEKWILKLKNPIG